MNYVVAFNRDRDSYQVPLALAEAGRLERLITDLYLPDCLNGSALSRKLRLNHRWRTGLSSRLVEGNVRAVWQQMVGLRLAKSEPEKVDIFKRLDRDLSRRALRVGVKTKADFFLYSGYARECFESPEAKGHRKALFVFHPHAGLPAEILQADVERHPEIKESFDLHVKEMRASDTERVEAEFAMADQVVCASTFTSRSLERINCEGKPLVVVPYGCDVLAHVEKTHWRGRRPRLLYVGQGVQRKGLHHLLKVWARRKDWGADLTLIAARADPAMHRLAATAGVQLLPGQSRAALDTAFLAADIFIMPSLVEGFGLVYLEALSAGCHVVGTQNTGLPDLQAPDHAATVLPAGDLDVLEQCIENLVARFGRGELDTRAICDYASTRSWEVFRSGIRSSIGLAP